MSTSCSWPLPIPCFGYDDILKTNVTSCCPDNDVIKGLADEGLTRAFMKRNSAEELISTKTLKAIVEIITCGFAPLILIVGVPCNVLCCLVFNRQGLKDRINVCLFSLALVDLCCDILWFMIGSFCIILELRIDLPISIDLWKWNVRKYIRGFHRGFLFSSGLLTMVIAVERCICVVIPLRASRLISTRTMTILIIFIIFTMQFLCLVYPFKFDVVPVYNNVTGEIKVRLPGTTFYKNHKKLLDFVENGIIMGIIPSVTFVVVTIATIITVVRLRKLIHKRDQVHSHITTSRSQIRLVKMLVVLSFVYIATSIPVLPLAIIRTFCSEFWLTGKYRNIFLASHLSYLQLAMVNSTVNFFVYFTRSARFRSYLTRFLPSCCSRLIRIGHSIDATATTAQEDFTVYSSQHSSFIQGCKSNQTLVVRLSSYLLGPSVMYTASKQKTSLQVERSKKKSEQSRQDYKGQDLQVSFPEPPTFVHAASTSEKEVGKGVSGGLPPDSKEKPSGSESLSSTKEKPLKDHGKSKGAESQSSKKGKALKQNDKVTDRKNAALPSKAGTATTDAKVQNAALPSKANTTAADAKVQNAALPSKADTATTDATVTQGEQQKSSSSSGPHYEELLPLQIGSNVYHSLTDITVGVGQSLNKLRDRTLNVCRSFTEV